MLVVVIKFHIKRYEDSKGLIAPTSKQTKKEEEEEEEYRWIYVGRQLLMDSICKYKFKGQINQIIWIVRSTIWQ